MLNLSRLSDEELMVLYQQGRMEAFEVLYSRHSAKVFGYLRKRVKDPLEAGDIFQSVFMKVHRRKDLYDSSFPFLPWLFTVTRTVMLDALRKADTSETLLADDSALDSIAAPESAERESPAEEVKAIKGYDELPEQQKLAIDLRYRDEKSFEEIARTLQTTPENVRQLVSRGIRKLKKLAGAKEGT